MDTWEQAEIIGFSPAKINLFLHILGRRADGYHQLQTAFHFLDWHDRLGFTRRTDSQIMAKAGLSFVEHSDNLIIKAALALQEATACTLGADIYCDKQLPMGGGLGGGSSNAATTLLALNQLWDLHLSIEQLMQIGLKLGADVPVFIAGHAAWAEGIGEQLLPIELPKVSYLLIKPDCFVSTAEVFLSPELTRDTPPAKMCTLLQESGASGQYQIFGHNDCEQVVRQHYPPIDQALRALARFADPRLTGTGACVFAAFSCRQTAQAAFEQLSDQFSIRLVAGMNNVPPLQDRREE